MLNCINLQNNGLIVSSTDAGEIRDVDGTAGRISLKRGTQTPLVAQFIAQPFAGVNTDLGTPLDLRFGAKVAGQEDGPYVVSNYNAGTGLFAFTKTGSGDTAVYTVNPGWNTTKLNQLLGYDPQGFAEETLIETEPDVAGSLDGKSFKLYDQAGSVGVWIAIDDGATSIPAAASTCTRAIRVGTIVTGETADNVALKLAAALALDSQFTGTLSLNNAVTVVDREVGPRTLAVDVDTHFTISRWVTGSAPSTLDNVDFVDLVAEWYWDQNGIVSKSQTFTVRVYFSVNNGNEGVSPDADPAYPAPGRIVTFPLDGSQADITLSGTAVGVVINNTDYGLFDRSIVAAAGSGGTYTGKYALVSAGAKTGAVALLSIEIAASANPTVEIWDLDTSAGTRIAQVTNPSPAAIAYWFGIFTFNGTHWRKRFGAFQ